jgi:hypothetical protein
MTPVDAAGRPLLAAGRALANMVTEPGFERISGKILPGHARRAVVQGFIRSRDGDGFVGVERGDGQADTGRNAPEAQTAVRGGLSVPPSTYPVVFSVDYILLTLTVVNY